VIRPHGADVLQPLLVADSEERDRLTAEADTLPSLVLSSAAAANAVMLGGGYFTPLSGFMNVADALSVARKMHTVDGLFWPIPILNLADDIRSIDGARRIALRDPNVDGAPLIAIMDVDAIETLSLQQKHSITEQVYGTVDKSHPGVAVFQAQGNYCVSGPIRVLNLSYFESEFPGTFQTAVGIRADIAARGWETVVAFQTRNPMHLAHEELCRIAMDRLGADGAVIHMLLGKLKPGDIPAPVRDACIRKMVELHFPENSVLVSGYGFDMLFAGPREAVLHAVFRQNMGATHLIVGRDHAGVGNFYGPFDAQEIFDQIPEGALDIDIFAADHTAWSKKLNKVVMMREAPDHAITDYVILSGTRVREMLGDGIALPPEVARPEVAQILMDHYRSEAG